MKITAGPLLLVCIGMLTNPMVGLAQAEDPEPAGQGGTDRADAGSDDTDRGRRRLHDLYSTIGQAAD